MGISDLRVVDVVPSLTYMQVKLTANVVDTTKLFDVSICMKGFKLYIECVGFKNKGQKFFTYIEKSIVNSPETRGMNQEQLYELFRENLTREVPSEILKCALIIAKEHIQIEEF